MTKYVYLYKRAIYRGHLSRIMRWYLGLHRPTIKAPLLPKERSKGA